MSELTKMNLIAIVQQLPDEDIEFVQQYITILEDKLQQKENIIKEVREYIEENCYKKMGGYGDNEDDDIEVCLLEDDIWELKEILDKGE